MESKIKDYLEVYGQFDALYSKAVDAEIPIRNIKHEIDVLEKNKESVDFNNPNVVVSYMDDYVEKTTEERLTSIKNGVEQEMARINNSSGLVQRNFDKVCKWLNRENAVSFVKNTPVDFTKPINVENAEKASEFNTSTLLNDIFGIIFRLNFLIMIPKFARIIAGVVLWMILIGSMLEGQGVSKLGIYFVQVLIIVANILAYTKSKSSAKKYLADNHAVCLALISPQSLKVQLEDYRVSEFNNNVLAVWKKEISDIKNNGLQAANQSGPNSIFSIVKADLERQFNDFSNQIEGKNANLEELEESYNQALSRASEMVPSVNSKETEVDDFIVNSDHNNGVLSPYVSLGFSVNEKMGVKDLIYIKHDMKPVFICYSGQTHKDGERFRKNVARVIEQMMRGFYQENYYGFIDMCLVDYESLYFPESRTNGLMQVVRGKDDFNRVFANIKETRKTVDALADGKISTINPDKLKKKENPIKYNIVFFAGVDLTTVDNEISQLFIGGENFGFIPFVFMNQEDVSSLLSEKETTKSFARVVRKANDSGQIYSFENIVSEFNYGVVVTSRKDLVDEKLETQRLLSYEEFVEEANSDEGLSADGCVYIDVRGLSEELFNNLSAQENAGFIRYFTLDGRVPEFMDGDKVMNI